MAKCNNSNSAFTLAELMIAAGIMSIAFCGLLLVFINCIILNTSSRDLTLAYNAVQSEMEEIKNTGYSGLVNGVTVFDLEGFLANRARGRIEISDEASNLKRVRIVASFKTRNRVIGEDSNLNGAQDSGEDANNNDILDSPVELVTLISG